MFGIINLFVLMRSDSDFQREGKYSYGCALRCVPRGHAGCARLDRVTSIHMPSHILGID